MGHAINANGNMILKSFQKFRLFATILPHAIFMISILNKRKATDEQQENDSKPQKAADFIKRNAGKLTALSFLPMVIEEGVASLRGQKVAKKFVENGDLSKEMFKKIKLTNLCGFSSYALKAISSALAVVFAIKVKDKIQTDYENQKLQNSENI